MELNKSIHTHTVFAIAEIREAIIQRVLIENGKLSIEDIKSCRLVNKSFLDSVSACLTSHRKPVFNFYFGMYNYGERAPGQNEEPKPASKFVTHMTDSHSVYQQLKHIPPFSLKMVSSYLSLEMFKDIGNCLEKCGSGCVNLELIFPRKSALCLRRMFDLAEISLPNLHTYTVFVTEGVYSDIEEHHPQSNEGHKLNFEQLVIALLACCKRLKECQFKPLRWGIGIVQDRPCPPGFENIVFPDSLEILNINGTMENNYLEHLGTIAVPKLSSLSLHIPPTPNKDGLVYGILENVSGTLKKIKFCGTPHNGVETRKTYLRLPQLIKLEEFHSCSLQLELEGDRKNLQQLLPQLTNLILEHQSDTMLSKWLNQVPFQSVTCFQFSLVDQNLQMLSKKYVMDVDEHLMARVCATFPNLKTLLLTCFGNDFSGMRFVFEHMRQLESLRIVVSNNYALQNSDAWNSLLLGTTRDYAAELRQTPHIWNSLEIPHVGKAFPSIFNLHELRKFEFAANRSPLPVIFTPLISDAVFNLALHKMSKLESIRLLHGFRASADAVAQWESEGRRLEVGGTFS